MRQSQRRKGRELRRTPNIERTVGILALEPPSPKGARHLSRPRKTEDYSGSHSHSKIDLTWRITRRFTSGINLASQSGQKVPRGQAVQVWGTHFYHSCWSRCLDRPRFPGPGDRSSSKSCSLQRYLGAPRPGFHELEYRCVLSIWFSSWFS